MFGRPGYLRVQFLLFKGNLLRRLLNGCRLYCVLFIHSFVQIDDLLIVTECVTHHFSLREVYTLKWLTGNRQVHHSGMCNKVVKRRR